MVQVLRIFINKALSMKYDIPNYDRAEYLIPHEDPETVALNEDELNKIYNYDFSKKPSLERVRDLFIIACWTGLRFGDWDQIEPYNITDDGLLRIKQSLFLQCT